MRPTECPQCGEMIEPTDLNCNNCGTIIASDRVRLWQIIQLPNGNDLTIFEDGTTSVDFPDGREVWINEDGTTSVEFPDGRQVWILEDGNTKVEFPDGQEAWILEDGTTGSSENSSAQ